MTGDDCVVFKWISFVLLKLIKSSYKQKYRETSRIVLSSLKGKRVWMEMGCNKEVQRRKNYLKLRAKSFSHIINIIPEYYLKEVC